MFPIRIAVPRKCREVTQLVEQLPMPIIDGKFDFLGELQEIMCFWRHGIVLFDIESLQRFFDSQLTMKKRESVFPRSAAEFRDLERVVCARLPVSGCLFTCHGESIAQYTSFR